jgi:polygalacturonase
MSRVFAFLVVFFLLLPCAFAASRTCIREVDPPRIDQSMTLCADNYYPHNYPQGLNITRDNIILDCMTSVLHGSFKNEGIVINNRKNVTITNCQVANYDIGIIIRRSSQITIINANFIHNNIGLKIIDSSGIVVENSYDISIKKPLQLINSKGNVFHYVNKNMQGEECRLNQCNTPTGFAAKEISYSKSQAPKKDLARTLRDTLRKWIYPCTSKFS